MTDPSDERSKRKNPQATTKWFNFRVLSPTSAILSGSYSMSDKHFKFQSRGKQGTAAAVISIILGSIYDPKTWTKYHVDKILEYGDKLYRRSLARNKAEPSAYMTTSMISPEFFFEDYKCLISTESRNVYGNLFAESVGCPDFADGLKRFFRNDNCGVVTAQGVSVGMWHDANHGYFYFDASPCRESGERSFDGTACIIRFKCLNDMQDLFLGNLSRSYDSRYCIDKVTILRVAPVKRSIIFPAKVPVDSVEAPPKRTEKTMDCTQVLPKKDKSLALATVINKEPLLITLSNYSIDKKFATMPLINQNAFDTGYQYRDVEVNIPPTFKHFSDGISILHGWTHESSEMYKGKGAQNVANCIMAIGMKGINDVRAWLRQTLDDILALGDALHAEVKAAKPNLKALTAADFNDTRVKIEGTRMFISVDLMTVVGTINSKIPAVLNLRQALGEFFAVHKDGIVECSSMAIAIWTQDDYFYAFDPRECDITGVRVVEEKGKSGKESKNAPAATAKKAKGKCCVMRFRDIEGLVSHFVGNIASAKKNDRFTVRHVSVMEDLPGLQPWFEFQRGEPGKTWILQGSLSNDSEEFEDETRGVQGLAMPVAALVSASEIPPQMWTRETVDDVVREGNEYFTWCIPLEREEDRELTLERLKRVFFVKNRKIRVKVEDSSVVGSLEPPPGGLMKNLGEGMSEFFKTHQFGLVEVKNLAVAVWKFEEELKDKTKIMAYYYFDPSPGINLNETDEGDVEGEPGASVIRAIDPGELARLIASRVDPEAEGPNDFFIHGFEVVSIGEILSSEDLEREKKIPIKPELNAYKEFGEEGACINGSFDQTNETIFKERTRNKQQAANALVSLAMRQFYNPHLWYQEVVDDILKLGDRITHENMANIEGGEEAEGEPPARNYLIPTEIEDTFDIGVNRFTVTIEEEKSRGSPAELTQLLEEFFNENSMGILRQERVMLPIWKEGDVFFMMDPRGRGQDDPKDKSGTAGVLWFTTIPSLASTLAQSLANDEAEVVLDGVELDNEFESKIPEGQPEDITDDHWYKFSKKREGVWELLGSVPISDEQFPEENKGKQSSAVAVVSLIFSKIYEPHQWTTEIVNEIVVTGDKLYEKSASRLGEASGLSVNDIVTEFFLSNRRINLVVSDCVQAGSISQDPKVQDLETGIDKFFGEHQCGVLTIFNAVHIPIWRWKDHYYCLISNAASSDPEKPPENVSALRFTAVEILSGYIREVFGNEGDYEISAIDIVDWNKLPPWRHDPSVAVRPTNLPPLNAFKRLAGGDARAILCGSTHQGSKIFPWNIRNKQTAANCIVALGMSVIKDPITWTKKTLDEILVVGTNVHEESVKFDKVQGRLRPPDVIRIFNIGANVLTADVEQATLSGQVAVPPPEPEVKGKGKAKKKKPPKAKKKKGKQKRAPPPPPAIIFLQEGLTQFFESNRAGVLSAGNSMIALWKDQGLYFLYDPRSRSDRGSVDDSGAACAMWFACLEPLYDIIFTNLEGPEKYGQYSISRVIIKRNMIEGLPGPVGFQAFFDCTLPPVAVVATEKTVTLEVQPRGEFNVIDGELSVLVGTISMFDQTFHASTRGLQSTAMAAVAIVMGLLHVPSTWTPAIIDCILKCGDILHGDSVRMARSGTRCLSPSELLTCFLVGDTKAEIRIHHHTAAGIVQVQDLTEALTLFFRNHCTGILHTPNLAVAAMQHCGKFYMFDPSVRNRDGKPDYNGAACVIKCENIMRMAWIFVSNCNYKVPSVYTLNAVDVLGLKFISAAQSCPSPCQN
ncbi:uncharacterized protein LOC107039093 [Diachasma alloeum]|uniref:uncharacterized protein LOC107039093 n=1 Tax=Diachasma alloeum TaxID=454923 RepID=UPI00073819A7|nr:uncharacterized protein LOC107039093 [Diachasma alloeum]